MNRTGLAILTVGALVLAGAAQPSIFAQAQAGLWEVSGVPGAKAPLKQCLGNVAKLAEFEHRGKACSAKIIKSNASSTVVEYSCGSAGFGRSQVDALTPLCLRIDTHGISNQLPFNYVLQARRIGDCPQQTAQGH